MKEVEKILKQETNEHTALILMMSILGEKLDKQNKLLSEILALLENNEKEEKTKILFIEPLKDEDYMD